MEAIPIPKRVSFFTFGFHPARFDDEVDGYFTCPVCAWVVRGPIACGHCEALVCKSCHDKVATLREDVCTNCKLPFVPSPLRLYPSIVYSRYHLSCSFTPFGCSFSAPIPATSQHEDSCGFRPVDCLNPRCCSQFRLMDCPFPEKLVCSQRCWDLHDFIHLYEGDVGSTQCLELFISCVGRHKDRFRSSLKEKLEECLRAAEQEVTRSRAQFVSIQSKLCMLRKQQSGVGS